MIQVKALRIYQKDIPLYVTALPLSELRDHMELDDYRTDNPNGYQRPLVPRRKAEIAKYVTEGKGLLPTSILACVRKEDEAALSFEDTKPVGQFAVSGTLTIPDGTKLWIVDGQHRSYGVRYAYEFKDALELAAYPFPLTIMVGVDRYTEMLHFNIINTTQKKMPTDIADRHLVQQAEKEGRELIIRGREKDYIRAKATRMVDALNDAQGPWFHKIAIPGVPGRDQGLIRQHAMVTSIEPALKDPWLSVQVEDRVAKLLARYWNALAELWVEAFESPSNYRVQATVGVYSLHGVFPSVVHLCLSQQDFSQQRINELLAATPITSEFWHKEEGHPYTLGTGMASIRALIQYIKDVLPEIPVVGL